MSISIGTVNIRDSMVNASFGEHLQLSLESAKINPEIWKSVPFVLFVPVILIVIPMYIPFSAIALWSAF